MKSTPALDDFFATALDYYLVPDLVRLRTEVRADKGPNKDQQGCTIATALLVFSLLDLVGFLIRKDASPCKTETSRNISATLSADAGLFPAQYAEATTVLIELFRHGMTHQVFPKACGLSKPYPPNGSLIFATADNMPHLNVDVLLDDLLGALKRLRDRVGKDELLAETMERRLVYLQKEDSSQIERLRRRGIIPHPGDAPATITTVTTTTTPP